MLSPWLVIPQPQPKVILSQSIICDKYALFFHKKKSFTTWAIQVSANYIKCEYISYLKKIQYAKC